MTGVQTCAITNRSEEHTSELQSHDKLVCRLLLAKKRHDPARLPVEAQGGKRGGGGRRAHSGADGQEPVRAEGVRDRFFFNDPAPTEIYPLSLHDALPI